MSEFKTGLNGESIVNICYVDCKKFIRADRIEALIENYKSRNIIAWILKDLEDLLKEDKPDE